jgi:hypothetical protein
MHALDGFCVLRPLSIPNRRLYAALSLGMESVPGIIASVRTFIFQARFPGSTNQDCREIGKVWRHNFRSKMTESPDLHRSRINQE